MATAEQTAARSGLARVGALLRRGWRALAWYANGITGQSKYACYLEHEQSAHPDREPLTEREFWRQHYAQQDADPGARCC